MSLLSYADDVLNLNRTIPGNEENFEILCSKYRKIGLKFISEKSKVVSIGMKRNQSIPDIVRLDGHPVRLSLRINYLGIPIGNDRKHRRELLFRFLVAKLRTANGLPVSGKARYKRCVLSIIFEAFSGPRSLALLPLWSVFSTSDKRAYRSIFFWYAEFLLGVPLWAKYRRMVSIYGIVDPYVVVVERRWRFEQSLDTSNNLFSAFL